MSPHSLLHVLRLQTLARSGAFAHQIGSLHSLGREALEVHVTICTLIARSSSGSALVGFSLGYVRPLRASPYRMSGINRMKGGRDVKRQMVYTVH